MTYSDALLKDLALSLLKTAKQHEAPTLYLLQTVPGIGQMLRLGLLYEIHALERCSRVPDFTSSARLGKCRQASGGTRRGRSGQKIGNAHREGAFSEAATLLLRHNEAGQKYLTRLATKHDTGKALSLLAPTLGRAGYDMLKRKVAFAMASFLQTSRSRAAEPEA
jgi:transposase